MEILFSVLLIVVLVYLLIHFAPGALSYFGYRGWYSTEHVDPVCKMKVEIGKGYGKMYEGKLYRCCSKHCMDQFDAHPQQYLDKSKNPQAECVNQSETPVKLN